MRMLAKRLDEVAFVVELLVAKKVVAVAFVKEADGDVIEVNVGVLVTPIVEVEEKTMLAPAVK